ncbi:LacI family DNA-binding transcriptional regulator [Pseudonocardia sp. C8]|uniref:LacI family DNA-binding transcriptional regulator n=1 Tax=Pseudonocardia sp. C8 TaxID=2762759 RepID=UPI00351C5FD0
MRDEAAPTPHRKPTIRTVAAAAGVSTATVSRVMSGVDTVNPDLARRVLQVAKDLSYRPSEAARGLARGALRNIGVLMPDLGNSYFHDIVKSMHATATQSGFRMLIADHTTEPGNEFETAVDLMGHVDGLALIAPRIDRPHLRELSHHGTPVVLVNRVETGIDLPMVGVDSFTAMLEVGAHLAALGHRRIVYLSGSELAWQDRERWRALQASSRMLGTDVSRVESDGTIETSYRAVDEAIRHEPTAIACFNDLTAVGVLSRLRDLGLSVPGDISVSGFDDIEIGRHLTPKLTTVSTPRDELGRVAWRLLADSIASQPTDDTENLLPARLIVRASTGTASVNPPPVPRSHVCDGQGQA